MGSPPAEESMIMSLKGVQALMPKVRTIRMLGSAALMDPKHKKYLIMRNVVMLIRKKE
jgi:hypothetical protein